VEAEEPVFFVNISVSILLEFTLSLKEDVFLVLTISFSLLPYDPSA
jgi:hypothetical protein